jgi:chromosome segregation ATPase
LVKAKELIATKTKEGVTKLVEQKDTDLAILDEKLSQANKIITNAQTQNQAQQIRDLEKQVSNYEKMIEIYKNKVLQKPVTKTDDELVKEENKRLQILSTQLKNQIDVNKRDITKSQERMTTDAATMNALKQDKVKLEQQIKKLTQDAKKEELASSNVNNDLELKKVQAQFENMEAQVRAGLGRQKELELKLQDALKNQKKDVVSEESSTKGKTAHLENNVRKLTQDLVESRNQMAEMKKETNKLRQDKIALQNQLDKMKKDAEKTKGAAPKPSGTPGKAA